MFGLPFVHYSTRILHSTDLGDMQAAILSADDPETGTRSHLPRPQQKVSHITCLSEKPERFRVEK
ncbi:MULTISPECIES: hypothetical protein [Ruegeria]|uniref:hypothetical protein n=1 Tax=Ruegeria TaxID=97050 RepID=UPI00147C2EB1|nr:MULTISPECIES: hypothetical protein [Ruegeria]